MVTNNNNNNNKLILILCCLLNIQLDLLVHVVDASNHRIFTLINSSTPSDSNPGLNYRTAYHFQPKTNWINDPNGPMYFNGYYHLFYQYNPKGAVWGNIVWGHSVSKDLVNWTPLDPAIVPTGPFDQNGCWSGSATILLPEGYPIIIYTGINGENQQVQNIAFPKDPTDPFLKEWIKPTYNPLMEPTLSNGIDQNSFRDPTTAWKGSDGLWRIVVGSKKDHRGIAILYRSKDFKEWDRAKDPLHFSDSTGMWECPDFYPVAKEGVLGLDTSEVGSHVKHVMKASLNGAKDLNFFDYYTIGTYYTDEDKYVPDDPSLDNPDQGLRYDYGKFYASKSFYDGFKKRRVLLGWLNESDSVSDDINKGWSGIHAFPRKVWLDPSGKMLVQWPVEEIESLRQEKYSLPNQQLEAGDIVEVVGVNGSQADVEVEFIIPSLDGAEAMDESLGMDPQLICSKRKTSDGSGGVGPFGLLLLSDKDLKEYTAVFFLIMKNGSNKYVVVMCSDQSKSSLGSEVDKTTYGAFVDVDVKNEGKLSLRTLIDHSVVESFGSGGKTCITARVYPKFVNNEDAHMHVFNNGTTMISLSSLNAWDMMKPSIS